MPTRNLTARFVEGVKPPAKGRAEYWDSGKNSVRGLCLRVTPNGVKTWAYRYYMAGRYWRVTLGRYPGLKLVDARAGAADLYAKTRKGINPALEKHHEHAEITVEELSEIFFAKYVEPNNTAKTLKQTKGIFKNDVNLKIGKLRIGEVRKHHIKKILDAITGRGANIQANRVFGRLRRFFNWAVKEDYLEASPMAGMDRPTKFEPPRERDLKPEEIQTIWRAIQKGGQDDKGNRVSMQEGTRLALELLLRSVQRVGEVTQAEKGEFDLEDKIWTIPASRVKNRRTHRVPLTDNMVVLIKRTMKLSGESKYLFPSPFSTKGRKGDRPISTTALNKALNRLLEHTNVKDVHPHDFRETGTTGMAASGILPDHYHKVLNHISGSVSEKHYDRYQYDREKRIALEAWERRLEAIIKGRLPEANVIAMGAA